MVDNRKEQKNLEAKRFKGFLMLLLILYVWVENNNFGESGYLTIFGMWALGVIGVDWLLFPRSNRYD
jgi:hypothetical protein